MYTAVHSQSTMVWPKNKSMALSLTWDDGRESQMTRGLPLLGKYGIKATFYVIPSAVEKQKSLWQPAVLQGHEIGNHSLTHPCSGNFLWSRKNALEEYSIDSIEKNVVMASEKLEMMFQIKVNSFAYPCGQTFVGKGLTTESYVPVIAKHFKSGRTWLDESPNDPVYCDMAQITGMEMDGKDFETINQWIENARKNHLWLVLAGHDIGDGGNQTTNISMLNQLFTYLTHEKGNDIWVAPVGEIVSYIDQAKFKH